MSKYFWHQINHSSDKCERKLVAAARAQDRSHAKVAGEMCDNEEKNRVFEAEIGQLANTLETHSTGTNNGKQTTIN